MTKIDIIQMTERCIEEIEQLRKQIEILAPKADAYDKISIVLNLFPQRSLGNREDIVWRLKKQIKTLQEETNQ